MKTNFLISMALMTFYLNAAAINLPEPPVFNGTGADADIWEYLKTSLVTIVGAGLVFLIAALVFSGGGGMLSSLQKARAKGEWGTFFVYVGSFIVVAVMVVFLAYYVNEKFLDLV